MEERGEDLLEWLERRQDGDGAEPVLDEAWQEAFEYTDPACKPLLDACIEAVTAAPTAGFELEDSRGRVSAAAELGWPLPKVAVFLPDEPEEDRQQFIDAGWRCFDVGEVSEVVEALSSEDGG